MKAKYHICIICIFSLILISCTSTGPREQDPITSVDIYQGSQGLEMEFLNNAPPEEIFPESFFKIIANVKNQGAYDIINGVLVLSLEEDYMTLSSGNAKQQLYLGGRKLENPVGDSNIFTFEVDGKKIENFSQTHLSNIILTACYRYGTIANADVCIDTDVFGLKPIQKACEASDISLSDQGAPVAVSEIEVKMLSSGTKESITPVFIIHVDNVGDGLVINKDKIHEMCDSVLHGTQSVRDFYNVVSIDAELSGIDLDCQPKPLRLEEGYDYVKCEYPREIPASRSSYIAPLNIRLDYGYTHSLAQEIQIKKLVR